MWIVNLLEARGEIQAELNLCENENKDLKEKNKLLAESKDITIESIIKVDKEKEIINKDFSDLKNELQKLRNKKCPQQVVHQWGVEDEDVTTVLDPGVVRVLDVARCKARRDINCTPQN